MGDAKGKKAKDSAVILGWVSLGLAAASVIGGIIIFIAFAIPKAAEPHKISNIEVLRLILFLIGAFPAYILSPAGGITGIISLVQMISKKNKAKLWLPVTGIVGAFAGFLIATLTIVAL
ncbi:MAG: hypothetical protein K6F49_10835 [Saccharofermentans sp.]|nr:hypothetical protein [Saccharofermentans sp.]